MNRNPTNDRSPIPPLLAAASDALAPQDRFSATPTSRNSDGYFRTDKPTNGMDSQWVLSGIADPKGKIPPTAFNLRPEDKVWYRKVSFAQPMDGDPEAAVRAIGTDKFKSVWGAEEKRFEHEAAAGRREVQRIVSDAAQLENDLTSLPATVVQEPPEPRLPSPRSLRFWTFWILIGFFCLSGAGAVANIITTILPFTQSIWLALMVSFVWVLLSVSLKIAAGALHGRARQVLHWSIAAVGFVGAVLWLSGLVVSYGSGVNLNDLSNGVLVRSKALPFVGQLLCEAAVGFACLTGMFAVLNYPHTIIPNENRRRISDRLARVNKELADALSELAKAEGNLAELQASCETFVAEGLAIVCLRREDAVLLAEMQGRHRENQRLLTQFTS